MTTSAMGNGCPKKSQHPAWIMDTKKVTKKSKKGLPFVMEFASIATR